MCANKLLAVVPHSISDVHSLCILAIYVRVLTFKYQLCTPETQVQVLLAQTLPGLSKHDNHCAWHITGICTSDRCAGPLASVTAQHVQKNSMQSMCTEDSTSLAMLKVLCYRWPYLCHSRTGWHRRQFFSRASSVGLLEQEFLKQPQLLTILHCLVSPAFQRGYQPASNSSWTFVGNFALQQTQCAYLRTPFGLREPLSEDTTLNINATAQCWLCQG
jgi:hypothetical protein